MERQKTQKSHENTPDATFGDGLHSGKPGVWMKCLANRSGQERQQIDVRIEASTVKGREKTTP